MHIMQVDQMSDALSKIFCFLVQFDVLKQNLTLYTAAGPKISPIYKCLSQQDPILASKSRFPVHT